MKSVWLLLPIVALTVGFFGPAARAQTKPLAGTVGTLNTPARVGRFQIILTGASFATRVSHSEMAVAEKGKKFLVLNYTVQNPGNQPLDFDWGQVRFTVVSADNANHENATLALNPDTMAPVNLQLKPAQKIPLVTYIEVPANDPIPKLMVQSENAPVVRYDLKGKVKKFEGIFAAPDGVTVLDTGKAKRGDKIDLGAFNLVVETVTESTEALGELMPEDEKKHVLVTVAFTNASKQAQNLDVSTYTPTLKDANDETMELRALIRAVGNSAFNNEVKPGETVRARFVFSAPKDAHPGTLLIALGEGRAVELSLK